MLFRNFQKGEKEFAKKKNLTKNWRNKKKTIALSSSRFSTGEK